MKKVKEEIRIETGTLTRDDAGIFCLNLKIRNQVSADLDIPITEIFEEYLDHSIVLDLFGKRYQGVFSNKKKNQFYLLDDKGSVIIEIYSKLEEKLGKDVRILVSKEREDMAKSTHDSQFVLDFSEIEVLSKGIIHHIDLFKQGDTGYHTFRIPGLLVCPNNIILVFAEARKNSSSDFGEIHCALRRSEDGGITWEPIQIIWKAGELAVQNPCPVYIPDTGEIILPILVDRKYPHVLKSKDLGKTWSDAIPLKNLYVKEWAVNGPCPGHSIRLKSGRLIVPCHHNIGESKVDGVFKSRGTWNSHFIISDDDGGTWERGHIFTAGTNEMMAAEIEDGTIFSILRQNIENPDPGQILVSWSKDEGKNSSKPQISRDLSGPVCQASVINIGNDRLMFSNPDSNAREKMTIRISKDGGKTWPVKKTLYHAKAAYSDLALLENEMICCAFECGRIRPVEKISFCIFKQSWITEND